MIPLNHPSTCAICLILTSMGSTRQDENYTARQRHGTINDSPPLVVTVFVCSCGSTKNRPRVPSSPLSPPLTQPVLSGWAKCWCRGGCRTRKLLIDTWHSFYLLFVLWSREPYQWQTRSVAALGIGPSSAVGGWATCRVLSGIIVI